MSQLFIDLTFDKKDFRGMPLEKGEYENCEFVHCDFSSTDLGGILFIDCRFSHCNLSLVQLGKTCFRDVSFAECRMWGLHFEHADPFGFSVVFAQCSFNHSSFYQMKLKKMVFAGCALREVDFAEAGCCINMISRSLNWSILCP
jgi:fluoroquinolone resistance protein